MKAMNLFEVHITVEPCDQESFIRACEAVGCKPIIMRSLNHDVLEDGNSKLDMITGLQVESEMLAHSEIARIVQAFGSMGIGSVREKIEVMGRDMNCVYHEAHLDYGIITGSQRRILRSAGLGISIDVNELPRTIATVRSHKSFPDLKRNVKRQIDAVKIGLGSAPRAVVFESCIFDTNIDHDASWLS